MDLSKSHWWLFREYFFIFIFLTQRAQAATTIRASMYPNGDVFLVRGEPLALNCTVDTNDTNINIYNLSVKHHLGNGTRDLADFITYYPDVATIAVNISETTLNDNGSYICYYGKKFLNLKIVQIGERPEPPKSIQCVSPNWKLMTCYVELSQKETYIPLNWTMEYRTGSQSRILPCTKYNASYLNCGIIDGSNIFLQFVSYSITVTGFSEEFNITLQNSTNVMTNICCIVKPDPVRDLNWKTTNNSSVILISWMFPDELPPYINMTYRVKLKAQEGWDDRMLIINTIPTSEDMNYIYKYMLQDLIPYADYTVLLSAKTVRSKGDLYWSEPAVIYLTTDSDIPGVSVSLGGGSYYPRDCGKYAICPVIYWKNPERKQSHGMIAGYQLSIFEIDHLRTETLSSTEEPASFEALSKEVRALIGYREDNLRFIKSENLTGKRSLDLIDFELSRNRSFVIKMKTGTEKGFSDAVSKLVIPSQNGVEKLRPHRVIAEIDPDNRSAVLSLEMTQNILCEAGLQGYIYSCTVANTIDNQTYVLCQDDVDWHVADRGDGCIRSSQNISLPPGKDVNFLRFGVSVDLEGVSGGIQWGFCRFNDMYNAPDVPLYRVDPVKEKHTEIIVTVLYENCYSERGGRPVMYQLVYEKFDGKMKESAACPEGTDIHSFPVDFDKPVIYLDNLEVDSQYIVCMRAVNTYGKGFYGKPAVVRTSAPQKDNLVWLWIFLGVIAVLLMAFGIFAGKRYFKRRCRDLQINDIAAHIKDDEENYVHKIKEIGQEGDSGLGNGRLFRSNTSGDNGVTVSGSQNGGTGDSAQQQLSQQISSTSNRNSASPTPSRKGRLSPVLSGYQRFIPNEEFVYDEYETNNLLENEEPDGINNDFNVEGISYAGEHKTEQVCIEEHKLETIADVVDTKIDDESKVLVTGESKPGINQLEKKTYKSDKMMTKDTCIIGRKEEVSAVNNEYVEENDISNLSKNNNHTLHPVIPSKLQQDKFDTGKTSHIFPERASTTGIPNKTFGCIIENPNSYGGWNAATAAVGSQGKPRSGEILLSNKENDGDFRIKLPNGLKPNCKDPENVDSDEMVTVPSNDSHLNAECCPSFHKIKQANNVVVDGSHSSDNDEYTDDDSLSDIDQIDNEDMFSPSVGCDGELTEFIESNLKGKSELEDFQINNLTNGYVDSDQISISSLVSNASSIQERQSPEKKITVNQGLEHLKMTSPLPGITENTTGQSETLVNSLKGNTKTDENQISKMVHEPADLIKSKSVTENKQSCQGTDIKEKNCFEHSLNEMGQKTSSGNSSGSGISSYVLAGNIIKHSAQNEGSKDSHNIFLNGEVKFKENQAEHYLDDSLNDIDRQNLSAAANGTVDDESAIDTTHL